MPHALTELKLTPVTKPADDPAHEIRADICVVGAGIAGLSAAIESAQLGRDVVLLDSLPVIGGQMVHSLIGLFCGVFGNAPRYAQLTHGVFDDIFRDLGPSGDLHSRGGTRRRSFTTRWRSGGGWRGGSLRSGCGPSWAPSCSR
jgi:glycine/D-amino acid oxidase-like deaminating enzyme